MSAESILDALDPEQRRVAEALHGPVCVLAGAGTGKTRAITHRIAYGVRTHAYNPASVLAVTFTARAAGEMRERLRHLGVAGVQARTFHAAALRQLSYFWPQVVGGQLPRIVEHKARLVAQAARHVGLSVDRLAVRDLASEIEWAKVTMVAPGDYVSHVRSLGRPAPAGLEFEQVVDVLRAYEDVKTEAVVIDFEDILLLLSDMLARHADVADQVRRQYKHFVVDEFQDVSVLQHYLLDQWLGGRNNLCVVGDPSQTIYSFAGASAHYLTSFPQTYPDATVVTLVRDYRSTPQVVDVANAIMTDAGQQGVRLVAQRPRGAQPQFVTYPDDAAEAAGTAERISRLIAAGTQAADVAVLYRTNSQSEALEDALAHRGIGYVVRGGQQFFEREEVKQAVLLLRAAAVAPSSLDFDAHVREVLQNVGWAEEPPAERGQVRERWDSLQALVNLADSFNADGQATVRSFVEHIAERAQAQHAPTVNGVTLSTIHAAKGLEWDAVFLVGASEGLLPISMAETDDAVAEERRLLYVAVTRAREHLTVSFARARHAGGRQSRQGSRFLASRWSQRRSAVVRTVPAQRADLDAAEARLFDQLRAWRLDLAQARGKPAFTILVDSTLVEIARRRPSTLADLATVSGIGATKLADFGTHILEIVAAAGAPTSR